MLLSRLNIFLLFLLVAVVLLLVLLRVDNSRPNFQVVIGYDMTYSPVYKAFQKNANFEDGRTMQAPVADTLARGEQAFYFEATPQEAIRAGEQLANPFQPNTEETAAAIERGQVVFQTFCTACHGSDAAGNGPVAQRGFPPPPSLLTGKSREMKDGQLFHILTFGQNSMPNFAAQLPPDRRWDVITYIRQLQRKAEPAVTHPPTAETSQENAPSDSEHKQDDSRAKP